MTSERVVYRVVSQVVETCAYGDKHEVEIVVGKLIYRTEELYKFDNGWEPLRDEHVWVDRQGNKYYEQPPMDYTGRTTWFDSEKRWDYYLPIRARHSRDIHGQSLTKNLPPVDLKWREMFRAEITARHRNAK